uniref:Uncharacterized protein n=1 Tax=Magnetococcus massalia (strain MO-1) TaxID=451514 RepID=A0A1S7LJZ7_MAGMO|nr:conserved protein of unknown function [Candidatus Magnetococcus massalia]
MEPEKAMWIAVLNLAVKDAKTLVQRVEKNPDLWGNPMFRREVLHIKRYFRSKSTQPGGFAFICDLMGIDVDLAVKQIEELYLRRLKKPVKQRPSRVAMLLAI